MQLRWARVLIVSIITVYINCVLTNIVSLRQRWYADTFNNGTSLTPLYDTMFVEWIHGDYIPLRDQLTLRDMVDVCTYLWVILTLGVWFTCSRKPILVAKALTAQILLIPTFSLSQMLTVVPDSTPNCLELYEISRSEDVSWVFWKYPLRACGDMLWSSDVTQLIIFTSMATQMVSDRRPHLRTLVWFVGECWTMLTIAFIFTARYQYSVDVIMTIVVVKLVMSHEFIRKFAQYCFVRRAGYYQRAPVQELPIQTI
tara:strand:- start:204 stop:971 length:768 start_codon:yes stop_codon:yes gene_type:complete